MKTGCLASLADVIDPIIVVAIRACTKRWVKSITSAIIALELVDATIYATERAILTGNTIIEGSCRAETDAKQILVEKEATATFDAIGISSACASEAFDGARSANAGSKIVIVAIGAFIKALL
jgi:hypothetical protein